MGAAAARARFVVFFPATMIVVGGIYCREVIANDISITIATLFHPLSASPPASQALDRMSRAEAKAPEVYRIASNECFER